MKTFQLLLLLLLTGSFVVFGQNRIGIYQNNPISTLDINGGVTIGTAYSGLFGSPANGALIQGNVGIGVTNPTAMLAIGDGLAGGARPWMTHGIQIAWDTDNLFIGLKDEGQDRKDAVIAFGDNPGESLRFIFAESLNPNLGDELMRLTTLGRLGIMTDAPNYNLEVNGNAAKPGGGSWAATSDARLKKNIVPFRDGLETALRLNPVRYNYNSASGHDTTVVHVGLIAQDVAKVAPYLVQEFTSQKDNETYLNLDPSAITYILLNAIGEQQQQIEALTRQLEETRQQLQGFITAHTHNSVKD